MGQRLVVSIINDGEVIANSYYHWSGYTSSTLEITKEILYAYPKVVAEYDSPLDIAINLLMATGAGLTENSLKEFCKMKAKDPFLKTNPTTCINRNEGLIEITEEGIDNSQQWSEGDVSIYIDSKQVYFGVLGEKDDEIIFDDYIWSLDDDNEKEWAEKNVEQAVEKAKENITEIEFPYDLDSIPFDEFETFANAVMAVDDAQHNYSFKHNGNFYGLIS